MQISDTLLRPIVTEKSTTSLGSDTYAFEVGAQSNKIEIKRAIEDFYGVSVVQVRTVVVRGKIKRFGRFSGKRKNWKKAYVTLADGQTLPLYEG